MRAISVASVTASMGLVAMVSVSVVHRMGGPAGFVKRAVSAGFDGFLSNFEWTADDQNGVALAIQDGAEPEEAAQEWVDANQDVWQAWLPAA